MSTLDTIFYSSGAVIGVIVGIYFYFFFGKYAKIFKHLTKKESTKQQNIFFKIVQVLLSIGAFLVMLFISYTPAVVLGHIFAFCLICDCIFFVIKLIIKNKEKLLKPAKILHYSRIVPIAACIGLLTYGFLNIGMVTRTDYSYTSDKISKQDGYKVALITDLHYDTVQDTDVFINAIEELKKANPDIVVLGGDIVDEGTSKERMQQCFEILGDINATYGVYFVYGNHDTQMYSYDEERTFSDQDLIDALNLNNIKIMDDETVVINNEVMLIGRQDYSNVERERISVTTITDGYNLDDYYTIVLDHQPETSDFEENAKLGLDLQLSGHTHGGQIFPTGIFLSMIGTPNYGEFSYDNFTAIVSSGITGWGYSFRTEGICEYVIVSVMAV